jgi:hypothetical protein
MIYFAFGSNMDPAQMAARCPSHKVLGRAFLPDHALCFPRRSPKRRCGTAGLARGAASGVWGVLYALNAADLARLHEAEGYVSGPAADQNRHDFVVIEVKRSGPCGETMSAFAYLARPDGSGARPSADYMRHLIDGAVFHALPQAYLDELRAVPTRASIGTKPSYA